jgi:Isochorismatase family
LNLGTREDKDMPSLNFDKETTALLVIDPYNDFISEGGKIWDRIKNVAEATKTVPHMSELAATARQAGAPCLLCIASSLSSRRLRELEVRCSYPEGSDEK